jgi:hypothetical protein
MTDKGDVERQFEPTTDAAAIAVAIDRLRQTLLDAKQRQKGSPDGARTAAIMALIGVVEFIESVDDLRGLATPLSVLGAALVSLSEGSKSPIFEPIPRSGGRRPDGLNRDTVVAAAAATMTNLIDEGRSREQAAKLVAATLEKGGVKLDGRRSLDWKTVANWRDQLNEITTPERDELGRVTIYRSMVERHKTTSTEWQGQLSKAVRTQCVLQILSGMIAQRGGT